MTLLALTLFSLIILFSHPEKTYPKFYEGKLSALDFDIFLETSLPFESLYDFILNYSPFNQVYIELYALCGIYRKGIQDLNEGN